MMEFFLSKMWAGLCGVMLLGACVVSIGDLGQASTEWRDQELLEELGQEIDRACTVDGESVHIVMVPPLTKSISNVVVRPGSIWLYGPDISYARSLLSDPIVLDHNGAPVGPNGAIVLDYNDWLIIEKGAEGTCTIRPHLSANVITSA